MQANLSAQSVNAIAISHVCKRDDILRQFKMQVFLVSSSVLRRGNPLAAPAFSKSIHFKHTLASINIRPASDDPNWIADSNFDSFSLISVANIFIDVDSSPLFFRSDLLTVVRSDLLLRDELLQNQRSNVDVEKELIQSKL